MVPRWCLGRKVSGPVCSALCRGAPQPPRPQRQPMVLPSACATVARAVPFNTQAKWCTLSTGGASASKWHPAPSCSARGDTPPPGTYSAVMQHSQRRRIGSNRAKAALWAPGPSIGPCAALALFRGGATALVSPPVFTMQVTPTRARRHRFESGLLWARPAHYPPASRVTLHAPGSATQSR